MKTTSLYGLTGNTTSNTEELIELLRTSNPAEASSIFEAGISEVSQYSTIATTARDESEAARNASQAARDTTASLLNQFQDRYLGDKSSPPSTDNDGDPLIEGALYFNSTEDLIYVWNGTQWQPIDHDPAYTKSLKAFGAVGDGVTDDTVAVQNWLESGGNLYAPAGTYLIASAGPDAGGVSAFISETTHIQCDHQALFKAGPGLDNDVLRLYCDYQSFTPDRLIDVSIDGIRINCQDQKNSTVVPHPVDYPGKDVGASATCDALSIRGEVPIGSGVYVNGFRNVSVSNALIRSNSVNHWQNSGGDTHLYIGGANSIVIHDMEHVGARDAAIYIGNDTEYEGHSVDIRGIVLRGCFFGAALKRYSRNINVSSIRAYDTAVPVSLTSDIGLVTNGTINDVLAERAWHVVRLGGCHDVTVTNVRGTDLGHRLEDGSKPTLVFTLYNAVVFLSGAKRCSVSNVHLHGVDGVADFPGKAVLLATGYSGLSEENVVSGCTGDGSDRFIEEYPNHANKNIFVNNRQAGVDIPVIVNGPQSINYDSPTIIEDVSTSTHTGSTGTATLKTVTIPAGQFLRGDVARIRFGGQFTGTAGKTIRFRIGASLYSFPITPGVSGDYTVDIGITFNTQASQRLGATLNYSGGSQVLSRGGVEDFASDVNLELMCKLETSTDSASIEWLSVERV